MAKDWQVRNGRVFFQMNELTLYDLVGCSGISAWNKPRGGLTPIRQQSDERFGEEQVTGYQRGSPDMAGFTYVSRLRDVQNFIVNLNCEVNVQALLGDCGDPNNYYGFTNGIAWVRCPLGDLTGEALSVISGDDVPIGLSNPFNAIYGPYLVDFEAAFLSRRTIAEMGPILDIAMFGEECLKDCMFAAGNGQYGYAVAGAQPGSVVDVSNIWFTQDYSNTWALVSSNPFAAGIDVGSVVLIGTISNHRIIVARSEAVGGSPAQIAYADCTVIGQTAWVNVNVGAVNGQYITRLAALSMKYVFAITNDGYLYVSHDGGATWTQAHRVLAGTQLNDISFTRGGIGWVVGNNDLLLHTADYGGSWSVVVGPNLGAAHLTACLVDWERKLEVGDSNGIFFGTVDEGITWVRTPPSITAIRIVRIKGYHTHWKYAIVDIAATAPNIGNSRVVRSTDGGASWRLWNLAQNLVPNNGLYALAVVDVNRCIVGGNPYPNGGTAFLTKTETNIDTIT